MTESSRIIQIVDYTALIAAGIEGVKSIAASGAGDLDDPLRPGQKIAAAQANPVEEYTHWSEVPGAPPVEYVSQTGTVELMWNIPMRLWLPKTDEIARRVVLPFYDRYLRAYINDSYLGERPYTNLALRSEIKRFNIGGDKNWSWLDIGLLVVERVNYGA